MTTVEEKRELIKEVLEAYPDKAAKRRKPHLDVYEEGNSDCGVKSNKKIGSRGNDHSWLCLRRSKRGSLGSSKRHDPRQSRACRLRIQFLDRSTKLLHPYNRS
jgi:hypothetical protein